MDKIIVSVYGYGRFGKLWAKILAEDFHVKVFSRRGLKKDEVEDGCEIVSKEELFNCDAMFFCVSISAFEETLIESKSFFNKNTVYFDTCSVKVKPVNWMETHLPVGCQIIATHPMFGPDSYYTTPNKLPMVMSNIRTNDKTFDNWADYFNSKKIKVEIMSPQEHDEMVAYSQGITHYIGRVLSDLHLKPSRIDTLGYRKLLEIIEQTCNDNWQLFVDLQKYNPYTNKMREDLHESIQKIYHFLKSNGKE